MARICLITCFIGKLPDYFNYYVQSAQRNEEVDFFVFTDDISEEKVLQNVRLIPLTLDTFNALASKKLNCQVKVDRGYKLCDFKPAYGHLFEEYLTAYEFWGYCDLDLIWGKINHFINDTVLDQFDLFTTKHHWIAGHFTLIRNNNTYKNIYQLSPDYKKVFSDTSFNYFFEESARRWDGVLYTFEELHERGEIVSMFDIVSKLILENKIRVWKNNVIREHPDPFDFKYQNGILIDNADGKEFMYYHFLTVKKLWRFYVPAVATLPHHFSVLPNGIYWGAIQGPFSLWNWKIKRFFYGLHYVFAKSKTLPLNEILQKVSKSISSAEGIHAKEEQVK